MKIIKLSVIQCFLVVIIIGNVSDAIPIVKQQDRAAQIAESAKNIEISDQQNFDLDQDI